MAQLTLTPQTLLTQAFLSSVCKDTVWDEVTSDIVLQYKPLEMNNKEKTGIIL